MGSTVGATAEGEDASADGGDEGDGSTAPRNFAQSGDEVQGENANTGGAAEAEQGEFEEE